MTFEVVASNRNDIERRAIGTLADYLGVPAEDVPSRCEIELEVVTRQSESDGEIKYHATVHARIK